MTFHWFVVLFLYRKRLDQRWAEQRKNVKNNASCSGLSRILVNAQTIFRFETISEYYAQYEMRGLG